MSDIAVSLRLLRALDDLATTADNERMCEQLVLHGRHVVAGCKMRVDAIDFKRLEVRLAQLETRALSAAPRSVALWKMEGFTNAEIAKRLGSVVGTVERKLRVIRTSWQLEVTP